jgi:hypothetical protein
MSAKRSQQLGRVVSLHGGTLRITLALLGSCRRLRARSSLARRDATHNLASHRSRNAADATIGSAFADSRLDSRCYQNSTISSTKAHL